MIYNLSINFLGNAQVEGSIAGFHVENRYLAALRGNDGKATIGIAINENGVGILLRHHLVRSSDYVPYSPCDRVTHGVQEIVRLPYAQFIEKYLVEFIIIVLPRMYQNMPCMLVEFREDAGKLDNFGSRTDDCHYFQHRIPSPGIYLEANSALMKSSDSRSSRSPVLSSL